MSNMRAQFEDEASQMKESQSRALDDLAKKHRVTLENTLSIAEKNKNRLLAVSKDKQITFFTYVIWGWNPPSDVALTVRVASTLVIVTLAASGLSSPTVVKGNLLCTLTTGGADFFLFSCHSWYCSKNSDGQCLHSF